jgi:hypothetical protein
VVEWRIECDARGCIARVVAQSNTDENCVAKVRSLAEQAGWSVAAQSSARDLCPTHARAGKPGRYL